MLRLVETTALGHTPAAISPALKSYAQYDVKVREYDHVTFEEALVAFGCDMFWQPKQSKSSKKVQR